MAYSQSHNFPAGIARVLSLPYQQGIKEFTAVKRVGATLSILFNEYKGFSYSLGPFIQLFLSEHYIKTIILPLLLLLPAILAALFENTVCYLRQAAADNAVSGESRDGISNTTVSVEVDNVTNSAVRAQQVSPSRSIRSVFSPKSSDSPVVPTDQSTLVSKGRCTRNDVTRADYESCTTRVCPQSLSCPYSRNVERRCRGRSVEAWIAILKTIAVSKSTDLGINLGYYWPLGLLAMQPGVFPGGGSMGSAAALDVQSFRPLATLLATLLSILKPKATVSFKCA